MTFFYYPSNVIVQNDIILDFVNRFQFKPKKLFLITGKNSMQKMGILDLISEKCKQNHIDLCVCEGVNSNPLDSEVDKICEYRNEYDPDYILGVGGTSVMDVSKIVAMQATNGGKSWDYINTKEQRAKEISKDALPLMLIPSTSGGGSESTPYAVIINSSTKMKKGMKSPILYPKSVLIDPVLLSSMPKKIIVNSGFDAFCQALESFTSKNSNFFSDFFAKNSLEIIINYFEDSWNDNSDIEAKRMMGWASFLSGLAIGITDTNLAHAMSHPLSALYNIPHGIAVWLCTFQEIQFNNQTMNTRYNILKEIFEKKYEKSFDSLTECLAYWNEKNNIKLELKNYNIPKDSIDELVDYSLEIGGIKTNSIPINKNQLTKLFAKVWEGEVA